jgi:hypothetical protein
LSRSGSTSGRPRDLLTIHPHLTPRDRCLLALLDDHLIATTDQLARVFFTRTRTCLLRLETLRGLGLLHRFRFSQPHGGTEPWKWLLGLTGAQFQAAATGRRLPTARAHEQHLLRVSFSPTLGHLLTTNEFFVRLLHAARTTGTNAQPDVNDHSSEHSAQRLDRWWPEADTSARFLGIQPDGHGLWTSHGRTVGLFLECDLGTENLTRLTAKLDGYTRLARAGGPNYPVLFWLPTRQRETNLQQLLRTRDLMVPVATATHDTDPAGPVWLPAAGWQRQPLHGLFSDHGPDSAVNPNWRDGHLDLTHQHP